MSQTIRLKRTNVPGNTWLNAPTFLSGEMALNTADRRLWVGEVDDTSAIEILTEYSSLKSIEDVNSTMTPNDGDVLMYNNTTSKWTSDGSLTSALAIHQDTAKPTGVLNRVDSTISFDSLTRTFTIQPAVTDYTIYVDGVKNVISTSKNIVISNTTGLHFIYMDISGTLYDLTTFDITTIFKDNVYIAVVYWNATTSELVYMGDERHGTVMDWATHSHFHLSLGSQYVGGFALGNMIVDGSGDLDTHAQLSVSDGTFKDEDIIHNIANGSPQTLAAIAQIPVAYREGTTGAFRISTATNFPITTTGTGRAAYNEWTGTTWQKTEVSNNSFTLTHIYATNDINHPIFAVMGINEYATKSQAQAGANDEISNLGELPYEELIALGTVIFQTADSYANAVKSKIISTDQGDDYVDWRTVQIGASTSLGDHNLLSGRSDANSHPISAITNLQTTLDGKENAFSKNTAFNKNFGTTTGTVAQGNDSRILNGQTAFGWGDHSLAGYLTAESQTGADVSLSTTNFNGNLSALDNTVQKAFDTLDELVVGSTYTKTDFTATAGQTVFTVSYTPSAVAVFIEGSKLRSTEYTATNGTSITLNSGVDAGTWVQVVTSSDFASHNHDGTYQAYDANLTSFLTAMNLPTTDGTSGYVLKTDGAGTISWGQGTDPNALTSSDIGVTVQAYDATILNNADIGVNVHPYMATIDADTLGTLSSSSFLRSNASDTATGKITIQRDVGASPTYSTGQFELRNTDAGDVSMGFHRSGYTACQLRHESNGLILSGTSPTTAADFYAYGNITAYSDKRLKTDIEVIDNAIDKVLQLSGYTFLRTNAEEGRENERETGVIAQEVQKVLPEAVKEDKDGVLSVAYGNMVGLLIEAIKELKVEIEELKGAK